MPDKDENSSNEALMALIDEHKPLLRSIIQLEVQNPVDADDVFQETVLAILEHFRAGQTRGKSKGVDGTNCQK